MMKGGNNKMVKITEKKLTNKEFYSISFDWGVFAVCYSIGLVTLFFSFFMFQFSFRGISLVCFIIGLFALYIRAKILKSKEKKNENPN